MKDKAELLKCISYATNWYNEHIVKGISPIMTDEDLKWYNQELKYINL
jgi:hypothetical protein